MQPPAPCRAPPDRYRGHHVARHDHPHRTFVEPRGWCADRRPAPDFDPLAAFGRNKNTAGLEMHAPDLQIGAVGGIADCTGSLPLFMRIGLLRSWLLATPVLATQTSLTARDCGLPDPRDGRRKSPTLPLRTAPICTAISRPVLPVGRHVLPPARVTTRSGSALLAQLPQFGQDILLVVIGVAQAAVAFIGPAGMQHPSVAERHHRSPGAAQSAADRTGQ